jgi:hypothetical protein
MSRQENAEHNHIIKVSDKSFENVGTTVINQIRIHEEIRRNKFWQCLLSFSSISGRKRGEVRGGWRKLHNEGIHNF